MSLSVLSTVEEICSVFVRSVSNFIDVTQVIFSIYICRFFTESDNSYVLSGSSSANIEGIGSSAPKKTKKKESTDFQSKYKQSTIDKRYGKKKRKHVFHGTTNEPKSIAKKSPTKIISSLET